MTSTYEHADRSERPYTRREAIAALIHLPDRFAVAATSTLIIVAGTVATIALFTAVPLPVGPSPSPVIVAIVASILVVGEIAPRCWIRSGPSSVMTPMALCGYLLVLLGVPVVGIAAAAAGGALLFVVGPATSRRRNAVIVTVRAASAAIAVGTASVVLIWIAMRWDVRYDAAVSWRWVAGAVLAGAVVLTVNSFVVAVEDSVRSRTPLLSTIRRGAGARLTAEGALLSLAPIWVVGLDFSLALLPLLVITTVLMFRSTRHAYERAYEAHHDPLTGLANRRAFVERTSDVFGAGMTGAVALMDLDRFKDVNDELGHDVGDALLIAFARRLTTSLPPNAFAARLGGDEFAVLLPDLRPDGHEVETRIERLRSQLGKPLDVTGFPMTVGASIGIAHAPRHGRSASDLLRAADVAMYGAKRRGTGIERYDDCIRVPRRGRMELLNDIGQALVDHQFRIHFQPQLDVRSGEVDTLEALIRWEHPVHGEIQPADFIGLVEQTDLIGPITELVLRLSTQGMSIADIRDVRLAINVSARSLQDRSFPSMVFTVLAEMGFPPERLEIEVTERALVDNPEHSAYSIERLRDAGVTIAIDDFGTGYSSFETLRQLEVDRVKIDGVFVGGVGADGRDRAIVASVVELAHRLGLDVVAEGVETPEVLEIVAALGCDVAQGFGIARPMPIPDLRGWLTQWNEVRVEPVSANSDVTAMGGHEPPDVDARPRESVSPYRPFG